MGLVHAEELGPFRRDFDTETVCEVLVAALRREFPTNATTALHVEIITHSDRIMCNLTLSHDRGSGWKVGKLELAFTKQPLGVYVRVGRFEVVEFLTEQLIYVVKATANGELAPTSPIISVAPPIAPPIPFRPIPDLTARETEIAHLLARGRTHPQIAEELVIRESTVDTHAANIRNQIHTLGEKPQVPSGTEWLAPYLLQRGYGGM